MTTRQIITETIPDVPEDTPEPIKGILKALKNVSDIREGRLGPVAPFDVRPHRFVTLRDLLGAGMTIASNSITFTSSITNTSMADMAEATIKGRESGAGTGDPQDLGADEVVPILNGAAQLTLTAGGLVKNSVATGVTATIPDGYQVVVAKRFSVLGTGRLVLEGTGTLAVV